MINKGVEEDYVIGSADVKSLYPSLDIEHTVDIVCQEFTQKKINIKGIDVEEVGLYLVLNMDNIRGGSQNGCISDLSCNLFF